MGRIKQIYLKRVAEKLLKTYPDRFSTEFQVNKKMVASHTDITSKSIRNKIAGYITHCVKKAQTAAD